MRHRQSQDSNDKNRDDNKSRKDDKNCIPKQGPNNNKNKQNKKKQLITSHLIVKRFIMSASFNEYLKI